MSSSEPEQPADDFTFTVIDIDHARARMGGCSDDILDQLAQILLDEIDRCLNEIQSGIESENASHVFRAAHTLKSSCSSFLASQLAEISKKIELLGRSGQLGSIPQWLGPLREQASLVQSELKRFLDREGSR